MSPQIHKIMIDPDEIGENGRMTVTIYPVQFPGIDERTYRQVTRSSMNRLASLTYRYRVTAMIDRYPTVFIKNVRK